nr:hypothetical protein [Tanacetum cinerariifolium]
MAWLEICGELRSTTKSVHWEPMFILYCRRSMGEDYRIAREINKVALKLGNVVTEKDRFLEELDSLGREIELNARKKELFIEKLKGVVRIKDVVAAV